MGQTAAQIAIQLEQALAGEAKALVLDIARNLRVAPPEGTPVQTGHARRNWIPSAGQPHSGEVDGDEYAQGLAAVLAWKVGDGPLWVSNSAPYIQRLNDGHSKQSPAGFVERAVDMALAKAQQRVGGQGAQNLAAAYSPLGGED